MINHFHIKTPRQKRALEVLLDRSTSVNDLGPEIGALNPRQIIFELRQQGFQGIIQTRRFEVTDRDGNQCRPGEYYIPLELKPIVERAVQEYVLKARTRRTRETEKLNNTDCSREV